MKKIIYDNKNKVIETKEDKEILQDFLQDILEMALKITHYKTKVVNHLDGYYDLTIYHGDGFKTQYKDINKKWLYFEM